MRTPAQIAATDRMKEFFHQQARLAVAKKIGTVRLKAKWKREHFDDFDRLLATQAQARRRAAA
jgi:hypothetical protein